MDVFEHCAVVAHFLAGNRVELQAVEQAPPLLLKAPLIVRSIPSAATAPTTILFRVLLVAAGSINVPRSA